MKLFHITDKYRQSKFCSKNAARFVTNKMAKNCGKCIKAIRGIEFAKCGGFCDNTFHFTCCGTTRPVYEMISSNSFWLCDECRATVNNRCLKELCDNVPALQALKPELDELKERITTLTSAVDASVASTTASLCKFEKQLTEFKPVNHTSLIDKPGSIPRGNHYWPTISRPVSKRRREEQYATNRDVVVGTNSSLLTTVATVPAAESKFWIYLSRIHPDVSCENIHELMKECLQCDEPAEVVKLVRKDVDIKTLRFVSFKVGINPKYKTTALSPNTWPTGILFREFIEYGSKNGRDLAPATPLAFTPVHH